jgi:ribosomal protein S18 acetylase RimI-like enzyme
MTATAALTIRRSLHGGDGDGIVALHDRVYRREYDRNHEFVAAVARTVDAALAAGWPVTGGAVWLLEREGRVAGSLALTDEGAGVGHVRWFVFEPELRGLGLGRKLVDELLAHARAAEMTRLELDTFSALTEAAHLYRSAGFEVTSARERDDWGPTITYQHYRLDLR